MSGGIVRAQRLNKYEIVPAETIEDARISFRALGILVRLLRLPDGGSMSSDDLSREGVAREGREAIRRALRELEESGYILTVKLRDGRGRWSTQRTVFDTAQPSPDPAKPDGFPAAGKPAAGAPDVGGPGVKSNGTVTQTTSLSSTGKKNYRGVSSELTQARAAARAAGWAPPEAVSNGIHLFPARQPDDPANAAASVAKFGVEATLCCCKKMAEQGVQPLPSRVLKALSDEKGKSNEKHTASGEHGGGANPHGLDYYLDAADAPGP